MLHQKYQVEKVIDSTSRVSYPQYIMADHKIVIRRFWRVVLYIPLVLLAIAPEADRLLFTISVGVLIAVSIYYFFNLRFNPQFSAFKIGGGRVVLQNFQGIPTAGIVALNLGFAKDTDLFIIIYIVLVVLFEVAHVKVWFEKEAETSDR